VWPVLRVLLWAMLQVQLVLSAMLQVQLVLSAMLQVHLPTRLQKQCWTLLCMLLCNN
jgi:hypothetical protein